MWKGTSLFHVICDLLTISPLGFLSLLEVKNTINDVDKLFL